ncbi:MAG: hypothetical protein M4579_007653, partial [Chaenotheca gracillima]
MATSNESASYSKDGPYYDTVRADGLDIYDMAWNALTACGDLSDGESEGEERAENEVHCPTSQDEAESEPIDALRRDKPATSKKKVSKATSSGPRERVPKLRPATDVLNRIRWDPAMDSDDFVVGYEDRFVGAIEIPLELWTSEQTDEEFIPQHRILYFRRRSDGVRVWDRKSKTDR